MAPDEAWNVLDTSVLLQGSDRPSGRCATTPDVMAEVQGGGRDARRLRYWEAAGLEVRVPDNLATRRVQDTARSAGNISRLSAADVSVLALALEMDAVLWSDDKTILDIARRLGIKYRAVREGGIEATVDWRPRCTGCGRWGGVVDSECLVCGSRIVLRRGRE